MRILLIRPGAIGDSLLAFPIMQALRTQQRAVHITFVSNGAVLPLAQAFQLADEVFDYGHPLWSELFLPPDRYSLRFRTLLEQTDRVICWLHDDDGIVVQGLQALGIKHITVAPGRPAPGVRLYIVDYLSQTIGMQATPVWVTSMSPAVAKDAPIAIHPGSGGTQKCWPLSSFITVIETLLQRSLPVLLLGGPADHVRMQEIQQHMRQVGETPTKNDALFSTLLDAPLITVAEHLQRCRGYLGNDSGITHLAAMLSIPTIALFGPSDPAVWHPIGSHVHILHEPDLPDMSPDTVMRALEAFILV